MQMLHSASGKSDFLLFDASGNSKRTNEMLTFYWGETWIEKAIRNKVDEIERGGLWFAWCVARKN